MAPRNSTSVPDTADVAAATPRRVHRGRLFRKYLLLILSLVTGALLVSGAISVYFTYQETTAALSDLQQEKAIAAASRIEQYVQRIEQQLAFAALPQLGSADVELRRIEFLKLLRQAPEVTDIAQLDSTGREQIAVSRLGMDSIGSGKDRSQEPAFVNARRGQPWFGPVYFRKETEPYMTIALRSGSDTGPVTVADVNLKFIWDVVSRIRIGNKGKAYVVDGSGFLVADPDIGLVLRKTQLSSLPHVQAALGGRPGEGAAMISHDLAGTRVLTSVAPIATLRWKVFAEQPVSEVYAKLNASILRTLLLLLGGLVISALAAFALARGMARPIRTLDEGARRIGEGDLDQQIVVHTGDELEGLAAQFNRMTAQLKESYAGLERKVEARTAELQNSLEQQTAISEILRVISSSPTDVQPVLEAVAERAAHLCDAPYARIMLIDGDVLRPAAEFSIGPTRESRPVPLDRTSITGRAAVDCETVHIEDVVPLLDAEFPGAKSNIVRLGCRAVLAVPLMREGGAYGAIFLYRKEPRLFSADQVALVQTFARQAAIAIDNVRLFNETKEALEQQTATAGILRVISGSPTDTQPVFDTILERVLVLCDASVAVLWLYDGQGLHLAAHCNGVPELIEKLSGRSLRPAEWNPTLQAALERRVVHAPDVLAVPGYRSLTGGALIEGDPWRTVLAVPMLREGTLVGAITAWRAEVRPFSDRQIGLVTTFADQAVIAIENVRLFNETREALDQQRASGEVLTAISNSIADTAPVFEKILASCERLFAGNIVGLMLVRDGMLEMGAYHGPGREDMNKLYPVPLARDSASGIAILDQRLVNIADIEAPDVPPLARAASRFIDFRSIATAPMIFEGQGIGALWVARSIKGPLPDKQVGLLKTFADQAVIAIQNARLVNETKEALDQQRASGEVLAAISSSISDARPVFDVILKSCQRLFTGHVVGVTLIREDGMLDVGANAGAGYDELKTIFPQPLNRETASGIAILDGRLVSYADVDSGEMPPKSQEGCHVLGAGSMAFAPMLFEGRSIGTLWVGRAFKGPFPDKQLALLKTFADQAVIAIQNARLFNETNEALEQQRASGEVLAAISSSIADTAPVFETILSSCERLFAGKLAVIDLVGDDGLVQLGAYHGPGLEAMKRVYPHAADATSATGTAIVNRGVVQFANLDRAEVVPEPFRAVMNAMGMKAGIGAPMIWEGRGIGAIWVVRDYAGPFSDKDIALLKTFADQAVIAIQNARLFNETKDALDQQRASGEVLSAISSSIANTQPVFDVILGSCQRLFSGHNVGLMVVRDDGMLDVGAYIGPGRDELAQLFPRPLDRNSGAGIAILDRSLLQFPDLDADDVPSVLREGSHRLGNQSILFAPMLFEERAIGALWIGRAFKGGFTDKQLALLKTFAEQAVIAIQNARLFHEIEDKSRQLEIANKHKSEFLANMSHELRTPLNAIIGFSEVLLERLFGDLNDKQDDYLKDIHSSGKHLLGLINDILDLSKIEAGRMELERAAFDLPGALANALTLVRERAQRHGIALGLDVDPAVGDIVADERKLKQILLNLLSNAVKFTPDGGHVDVIARREPERVVIAVRDTGIGIAPEDQAAVFEEFRQVGTDYTRKQEGTGLGLALARRFVELHGGHLTLESALGKGSTFTFDIPITP